MKFVFIAKHRNIWPVSRLCEVLQVSCSGFNARLNHPTSIREIADAKLVGAIETSFKASEWTYGARRVWRDVLEEGFACGLHRIERVMRLNALRARSKRCGKPKCADERSVIVHIEPVVLDLFSRRAVGWSRKADRDASLVMDAVMMAVWRRGKADVLLHHCDSQKTGELPEQAHDHGFVVKLNSL